MRKGKKATAFLIFGALVAALAWNYFDSPEPSPEPHYRDKPLSYWVLLNARRRADDQYNPAVAIAEIGTNAVPYLLKWMSQKPYNWQKRLRTYRSGNPLLRKCIPFWATGIDKENRAMSALAAMQCLGPAGRSAIPYLLPLATNSTTYSEAEFATAALCNIGGEAIPALLTVAANRQALTRMAVIKHLGKSGSATALPTLIRCLDDPSAHISCAAAIALGKIKQQPTAVTPFLIGALERAAYGGARPLHEPDVRFYITSALGEFGTNANAASGAILLLLEKVREDVPLSCQLMNTLSRVTTQPETTVATLTNYLQSTSDHLRECAAQSLSRLGPRAESALPSLTNALQFPGTLDSVTAAIRKISSDAPQKPPPR